MFRIKICGITNIADAQAVVAAGADAVGLNFFAGSPRAIDQATARAIVELLPRSVLRVGVFVDSPWATICEYFDTLGLDLVQLHGDEPPELVRQLAGRPVMRAFRCREDGLPKVLEYLRQCNLLGCSPRMVLIDAQTRGQYGGTGALADWTAAAQLKSQLAATPLVLAGGLTPANVAEAIRAVRPSAVDTASGVERDPRQKDPRLVREFVATARSAFAESFPRVK